MSKTITFFLPNGIAKRVYSLLGHMRKLIGFLILTT